MKTSARPGGVSSPAAVGLVDRHRALGHRVAAAVGPDDGLAAELEAAGREAAGLGRAAQAAAWLAQAAAVSGEPAVADRRGLDALEILVIHGEVAEAEVLAARMAAAGPDARRSWVLGTLDFHAGRLAAGEARLREAWQAHDRVREPSAGAEAAGWMAGLCLETGRIGEAIEWGERAAAGGAAPAGVLHAALGVLAIAHFAAGRGPEGLARLAFLPAAPAEVPREDTDTLVMRGLARLLAEDLTGAVADLSAAAARLRAGVPLRSAGQCLSYLAAPSIGSDPGMTRWCTPSWRSRSPTPPTGCGNSASCTLSPLLFRRSAATGRQQARTRGWPPRPARPPAPRGQSPRPPSLRRSPLWPAAIRKASPTLLRRFGPWAGQWS